MANCYWISQFGSEPVEATTDWIVRDKEYYRVGSQLLHKAFVFPIESIEEYKAAREKYNALRNEAETMIYTTLNKLRRRD